MRERKKTGWIPLVVVIVLGLLLLLLNYNPGPSAEDIQKFESLKVECAQLESMSKSIEKKESEIAMLQDKLKTKLTRKEKKALPVQLGLLTQENDSLKENYKARLSAYEKRAKELPKELADSLKNFQSGNGITPPPSRLIPPD